MGFLSRFRRKPPPALTYPEAEGLLTDLRDLGYANGLDDLAKRGVRFDNAIPVLLKWLPNVPTNYQSWIVDVLRVPWAKKVAVDPLLDFFQFEPVPGDSAQECTRWSVGNTLEYLWTDTRFDVFAMLVQDSRFGEARQMLASGMGKSKRKEAADVLISVLSDPSIGGHALEGLSKLGDERARPYLEAARNDERDWVRAAARRGLAKLDTTGVITEPEQDDMEEYDEEG